MAKFDVTILNAAEEEVLNNLSDAIKKYGMPKLADTIKEQTLIEPTAEAFINYWEGLFPDIGQNVLIAKEYVQNPMWGSLYPLNGFRMGIVSIFMLNRKELPEEAAQAIARFKLLLIDEANEVGAGTQKFVDERYEKDQA